MKIAILTIQSVNCGNRLQNYALQTVLERCGHNVETLRREAGFQGNAKSKLKSVKRAVGLLTKHKGDRLGAFKKFNKKNLSFSRKVVSKEVVSAGLADAYDCFVIGSDQVWNPDFDFNSELDYLPMISSERKLAYAASFGVSEISDDKQRVAHLLKTIPFVSVREGAGAQIVYDLTKQNVPVVLDPTLLLSADDWASIMEMPSKVNCGVPFILKYVIGKDANKHEIDRLAKKRNLPIVDIMNPSLAIGPSEFVWLVANSEIVCTDSFHASVFALLHHKPLAIFERVSSDEDMSSRFDTLCGTFSLENLRVARNSFVEDTIFETDWPAFETKLSELREFSLFWLRDALAKVDHA